MGKCNISIGLIDICIQGDSEFIGCLLIFCQRTVNSLGDSQVTCIAGILKSSFILIVSCDIAGITALGCVGEPGNSRFSNRVGGSCRKIGQFHAVTAVQGDGCTAAGNSHTTVDAICQGAAVSIFQFYSEREFLCTICGIVADDRLADFQAAGLVFVIDFRQSGFTVRQSGHSQDSGCRICRHCKGYSLISRIVRHARRGPCSLLHGEGVSAGDCNVGNCKCLGFIPLQRHACRTCRHSGCTEFLRVIHPFCQGHSKVFISGIFACNKLLYRDFCIHFTVIQLGQEDQCNAVFLSVFQFFRFSLYPSGRNIFNPPVIIANAVCIHLFHADSIISPVVALVQDNACLACDIFPR